jgi:hypothetical protein
MARQSEGFTPAYVAAAVVRGRTPEATSFRDASVVHHVAGALAGVLYALVALGVGALLGLSTPVLAPGTLADGGDTGAAALALVPHAVGVVGVVAFIYAFFAHLVLPRAGGVIYEERATAVRGQWLRSSLVFGAALAVVAPVAAAVVV